MNAAVVRHLLRRPWLALLLLAGTATSLPAAERPAALLDAAREASGGTSWDAVRQIRAEGTLAVGGLSGPFVALEDLSSGASRGDFNLGAVRGAQGFDGKRSWSLDPGGELRFPDSAPEQAAAVTQAWLARRAYWYPERQAAHWGEVRAEQADGSDWQVVEAKPAGGIAVTLWFDARDHHLKRLVTQEGQTAVTTQLTDWRAVDGLLLPFASTVDRGDPRNRVQISYHAIQLNPGLDAQAFAAPQPESRSRIADASGRAVIPFELRNNHIYAQAFIDGQPVRMLVDTGGVNIITPEVAQRLGLKTEGQLAAQGVGERQADYSLAKAGKLTLGAAELEAPVLFVLALGDLAGIEGETIDGIVGYELFHHFGVRIDYAGGTLTLTDPARFQAPPGATALPFELADRIPVVQGTLDGLPVRISIDTGSRASLTLHSPFVRQHGLVARYGGGAEAVIGFGVGGASRGIPVRMGELDLNGLRIPGIAGDLFMGDKGAFANPAHGANLGSGLLKRFVVSFDYRARRMYLEPVAGLAEQPDAFDRSGLWLRQDGPAALRILDIAADTAAAQTPALKVDQRITAIDGEAVSTRSLSDWRARLRESGRTAVDLTITGKRQPVRLVLKDRIADSWQP